MTKISSHDAIERYSLLDPATTAEQPTPSTDESLALFEKVLIESPRVSAPLVSPSETRQRLTQSRFRARKPMILVAPVLAVVVVAVLAATLVAPAGTSPAEAEIRAAAAKTAAFNSGQMSTVFTSYVGDEAVGTTSVDYRFIGNDFDYRHTSDADMSEYLSTLDMSDLLGDLPDDVIVDLDEVTFYPETLARRVGGASYTHDGVGWVTGAPAFTDLGDVEGRALAATYAAKELESCGGPADFDSFCGTSDDVEVIAALLLTLPEMLTADIEASIRIDIDESTGLVRNVHATLTSDEEKERAGFTRTEVTVDLSNLGRGESIEAPNLSGPSPGPAD